MQQTPPSPTALRVSDLLENSETLFDLRPDASRMREIAEELDLSGLRKLSFVGSVKAHGKADWILTAKLGATVVQPCGVTLGPVTTRIDESVTRLYLRDFVVVDAPEAEMPEDDTTEALGRWIDPDAVMIEALVLHLPLYPRADGAALGQLAVSEPGVKPMTDEDARPFAGLAALKEQLASDDGSKS